MPFAVLPVTFVRAPSWPGVDTRNFETIVPGAGIFPLAFEASADAVSVGFAILPTAAVHSTVIEIEPATLHRFLRAATHAATDSTHCTATGRACRHVRLHFGLLAPPPLNVDESKGSFTLPRFLRRTLRGGERNDAKTMGGSLQLAKSGTQRRGFLLFGLFLSSS